MFDKGKVRKDTALVDGCNTRATWEIKLPLMAIITTRGGDEYPWVSSGQICVRL